ncbi:hypothetical protein ACFQZ4_17425 [Catellatospora coxensis]
MTDIGWLSQPYPPEGATAAEGIRNQLGRPELDHLTVLVREAAQNSWDARAGSGAVDFRIDLSTVSPAHAATGGTCCCATHPNRISFRSVRRSPTPSSTR